VAAKKRMVLGICGLVAETSSFAQI